MPLELDQLAPPTAPAPATGNRLRELLDGLRHQISAKDRRFFTEQLAMLLDTGTALHAALQILSKQADNPALSKVIDDLLEKVGEGQTFAQALARHPAVFSRSYVALVAASETGGYLPRVLEELQKLDEKRAALFQLLFSALSYPAFLVVFSFGVIVFVLTAVFPKFSSMFEQIHDRLPLSTRILMAASNQLIQHWYLIVPVFIALIALAVYAYRSPVGQDKVSLWKLTWPGLRQIFVPIYFTQTLRVMGLSLANGVPLMAALAASREVVGNRRFQGFLDRVAAHVEAGEGFAIGFEQAAFVPNITRQMIRTGEATGNLARVMERIADHYEREATRTLAVVSRLAEPLMLIVMGGVVGLIVASLILPIFQLSHAVH